MTVDNSAVSPGVLRVAINAPLRNPFDYLPPPGLAPSAVPLGVRVRVPVGAREAIGMVVDHADQPSVSAAALKAVHQVLDATPLLDTTLMQLLRWTADYYHHPLGEVIAAALPKALREGAPVAAQIECWRATAAGLEALAADAARRSPKQQALLALLATRSGGLTSADITAQLPRWRSAARALLARGWIERLEVSAAAGAPSSGPPAARIERNAPALSAAQSEAVAQIDATAGKYAAWVLQGATGSGKTEVYLQCAAHTLARSASVLVLVPEIGLTPQLVQRFRARLKVDIAVLHSGLSDAERLAAWRAARSGQARAVLGTRSAVFAPVPQLGLIVVDEEHDSSYKQHDGGCRYSARDLAVVRAQQAGLPVVLGSATPALETLQNLIDGRYRGLSLPRREDQALAPRLALIDLRAHTVRQGLSTPVIDAMRRHLSAPGQVLVFINRRGYAPTLLCTSCGWIAPCHACDARLTVHRAGGQLRCHHCGATEALPERCLRCGFAVKPVGQGTERVEETLRELFPDEALIRLDRDSASRPEQLESIIGSVLSGEARILVGTQMVTKGHHFPGISLVVVLNADQGLFSTDFRAAERLAQTIVQVAGRAGRERNRGEVLIQTQYPDHPLLQSLLSAGYEGFAAAALIERAAAQWPPFGRLAVLRASTRSSGGALAFLAAARKLSPGTSDVRLLGPVAAAMARRADRYHAQLLIESADRGPLHRFIDNWLPQVESLARAQRVRYALDVDPIDIQ
ncbi:MAG TPA: primosomal protein N' [Steroidobacteraceae bacterium]|nr:primosomal protein N' [Steroidobacteraceae bacterium]